MSNWGEHNYRNLMLWMMLVELLLLASIAYKEWMR